MNTLIRSITTVLLAAAATGAQDASHTFRYGNSEFGGSVRVTADADFESPSLLQKSASLDLSTTARIRMSGVEREAVHVAGGVDAAFQGIFRNGRLGYTYGIGVNGTVRIGGYTVLSRTRSDTVEIGAGIAPANVYGGRGIADSFTIGPFTLEVRANARASFDLSLRPTINLLPPSVGLALDGQGPVDGSYALAVGLFGLTAGVSAHVDLADPVVTLEVHTNFVLQGGSISWVVDRVFVTISGFVRGFGVDLRQTFRDLEFAGSRGSQHFGV